jgi:hypothetical protein
MNLNASSSKISMRSHPFFFYFFVWMIKEALPLKATIYGLINAQAKDLILGNEEKQNSFLFCSGKALLFLLK